MARSKKVMEASQRFASPDRQALNWLIFGISAVSLFLWASVEDPFNVPKSALLAGTGFWLFGYVAFEVKRRWRDALDRKTLIFAGAMALTFLAAFLATDFDLQGFFGDYGRRTGFFSYFSLIVFFLAASFLIKGSNIALLDRVILIVGFIIGFYGFLQHFKIDPITWNNPYNSVLSTLGNPDFAAAVMAILLILAVGLALNSAKSALVRGWALINIAILLVTILFSQVRQGLLAAAIGIAIIALVWIYQRSKRTAWALSGLTIVLGLVALIGMLDKGPLKSLMYKVSVTYRGDYWRAGIRMFTSHPWFGVGLERYGAYFREYRDATQALRRGPNLVSNAAHNVPIQLAATGGAFLLIAFLALTGFILWRGIVALRNTTGIDQIVVATFFGAWIAYEAQSLISIDNLGIAIWGWSLGGMVVALSRPSTVDSVPVGTITSPSAKQSKKIKPQKLLVPPVSMAQPLVSGLLVVAAVALSLPIILSDAALKTLRTYAPPTSQNLNSYLQTARKPLEFGFQDPHAKIAIAILLAQAGQAPESKSDLRAVLEADPRSFEALNTLAVIDEQTKNLPEAITYRQRILAIDPWNYQNMLQLGEDLKATGNFASAKAILPQIDAFAAKTTEAMTAHKDFGP